MTSDLPVNKMYAVRHGKTGKIFTHGACWLWQNMRELEQVWKDAKEVKLVQGDLRDHKIVTIQLREMR